MNRQSEITAAISSLGIHGTIRIEPGGEVYINDKYFGKYDFVRHTFTD